jgi:hypothetical protein
VFVCGPAAATTVEVENAVGSVLARVVGGGEVRVRHASPQRPVRPEDTRVTRLENGRRVLVRSNPSDRAPIRLEIDLPYGVELEISTRSASTVVEGLVYRANITTKTGSVELRVPLEAMRLEIESREPPGDYQVSEGIRLSAPSLDQRPWRVKDELSLRHITYGSIHVKAEAPERLVLTNTMIPAESPVKLPWQAPEALRRILKPDVEEPTTLGSPAPDIPGNPGLGGEEPVARFTSDVRMVNLTISVTNKDGAPVANLEKYDFRVLEN